LIQQGYVEELVIIGGMVSPLLLKTTYSLSGPTGNAVPSPDLLGVGWCVDYQNGYYSFESNPYLNQVVLFD
jgi:hypothetical protein